MRESIKGMLRWEELLLGTFSVLIGALYRLVMSFVLFLQADEEIFAYDSYYFILGEPIDFIVGKIGTYLGYPLLLSLWFRVFGVSIISARIFSVVCSALFLLFVFLTLKKVLNDPRAAMLGTLLLALLPFPLRYGHMVLSEPLAWAVLSAGLYLLIKGMTEERWKPILFSGMLCASVFFIRRSALILLFVIFPALLWVNRDRFGRMLKESFSWLAGFLLPFVIGITSFVLFFGWDKLEELRWTRIPNITPDWTLDLGGISTYEYALYALQPTVWKGTFLVILMLLGGVVILMSLFRDRWKAVFAACFLWPAFMRVSFDMHMNDLALARLTIIPVVVLFIDRTHKRDHRFFLALSLLIGSTVGFSTVQLSGDIWNVMIYLSVAGIVLLYLSDRLNSRPLSAILLTGGLISLYLITFKEPQIADLVRFSLPVTMMVYGLSLVLSREAPKELPLTVIGAFVPMLFLHPDPSIWTLLIAGLAIALGMVPLLGETEKLKWSRIRFVLPLLSIATAFFIPEKMPAWGIYLPLLGMIVFMLSYFLRSTLMLRLSRVVPLTGAILAFGLAFHSTRSIVLSLVAAVLIGATSTILLHIDGISMIWREKVGERISVVLLMIVVGYMAFYVYYAWTEVYMTEFLFPAVIIGGILLWALKKEGFHQEKERSGRFKFDLLIPKGLGRNYTAMFLLFLMLSIPVSVGAYLDDQWFREESMDKRPYMRTISEVAEWIEENSDEDDMILAWHCYAIEADRETVIGVSNAAIYNGYKVVEDMKTSNVTLFVRDWYTDHGIWRDQRVFQDYILENFVIDRVIDGNECWVKVT